MVFSTKSNPTTRENIANVFGAKTLTALLPLDMKLELQPTLPNPKWSNIADKGSKDVRIVGHISRPIVGEGRQMPDRQMFFVNSRPCGQPQVARAFNEVYKSYNISQSPFIFADLRLDENSYDVNVSPDKRTILLHDQNALLESLKESLIELFESTDQTVPHSQGPPPKLPAFKQLTISRPSAPREESLTQPPRDIPEAGSDGGVRTDDKIPLEGKETNESGNVGIRPLSTTLVTRGRAVSPARDAFGGKTADQNVQGNGAPAISKVPKDKSSSNVNITRDTQTKHVESNEGGRKNRDEVKTPIVATPAAAIPLLDFNERVSEQEGAMLRPPTLPVPQEDTQDRIPSTIPSTPRRRAGVVQFAFDRMRPKRVPADTATITIGSKTISSPIGTPPSKRQRTGDLGPSNSGPIGVMKIVRRDPSSIRFSRGLRSFIALGSQPEQEETEARGSESSGNEGDNGSEEPTSDIDAQVDTDKGYFLEDENCSLLVNDDTGQGEENPLVASGEDGSDGGYLDEESKRAIEEDKVRRMIQIAEEAAHPSRDNTMRADKLLRSKRGRDSTTQLSSTVDTSVNWIDKQITALNAALEQFRESKPYSSGDDTSNGLSQASVEERLSLIVSKEDFADMRIVGQFNLGFIIATRPAKPPTDLPSEPLIEVKKGDDELFIIDQHASDEKYNFERLQAETIVQNQRLVKPRTLELTAVDEEIITEHQPALVKNGFLVDVDPDLPPGKRCKLVSLPMSHNVVFDHRDLEELISLLADAPIGTIPRPSKVRRMFAMRACRSSIMIGRTLTLKHMQTVLQHMGEIEKPWNCPHGRPTMRHLMGMGLWEGWEEGDGVVGVGREGRRNAVDWGRYVDEMGVEGVDGGEEEEDEDEQYGEGDEI
ncbi:MAG: hypothetical protein M1840_003816 [Geoglossum simile]|nr:MAG: hypothetical protein M1840_003816 [Geoglossum simile]